MSGRSHASNVQNISNVMTTIEQRNDNDKWWFAAIITVILMLLFSIIKATAAEKDTIPINYYDVERVIEKQCKKSIKYYIIYRAKGSKDLIDTNKSTVDYIKLCAEFNVPPVLGLVLKNNRAVSIVRINQKYNGEDKKR